jgi:hypothetical protein
MGSTYNQFAAQLFDDCGAGCVRRSLGVRAALVGEGDSKDYEELAVTTKLRCRSDKTPPRPPLTAFIGCCHQLPLNCAAPAT